MESINRILDLSVGETTILFVNMPGKAGQERVAQHCCGCCWGVFTTDRASSWCNGGTVVLWCMRYSVDEGHFHRWECTSACLILLLSYLPDLFQKDRIRDTGFVML